MTARKMQTVGGSGNVFRDLRQPDADVQQLKALLAAEIVPRDCSHGREVALAVQMEGAG